MACIMAYNTINSSVYRHQSDMLRKDTLVIVGCKKESNLIDMT